MSIQNIANAGHHIHQPATGFVIAEDVIMRQAANREGPITEDVLMRQQTAGYVITEDVVMRQGYIITEDIIM